MTVSFLCRFIIPLFIIVNFTTIVSAQQTKKAWSITQPLQWSDYMGEAPQGSKIGAETYCGTDYGYHKNVQGDAYSFTFEVSCYMDEAKSWVRPGGATAYLLHHEQLHFDISEFFARQLLSALSLHQYTANYADEMEQIDHEITRSREMMQAIYDRETYHSLNQPMQARWDIYVADLLSHNYTLMQALEKMPR